VLEGRDEIERIYQVWFTAFPDLVFTGEDLLIDGDRAALLFHAKGTHQGEFFDLAATGRRVDFTGIFLYTLDDEVIVHERRVLDFTGVLVQVGVLKARPGNKIS
jgi:predicted ester cyclase